MDDITLALLESALDVERRKLARTSNPERRSIVQERIAKLQELQDAFSRQPIPILLSSDERAELLRKLEAAARGES